MRDVNQNMIFINEKTENKREHSFFYLLYYSTNSFFEILSIHLDRFIIKQKLILCQ